MKLKLGFSDEIDEQCLTGFLEHNKKENSFVSWEYNLYQNTEAKHYVTWQMLDKPCVQALRQTIEHLQQGPYMTFVRCDKNPFKMVPNMNDYMLRTDFIGLLDPEVELAEFKSEDIDDIWGRGFGNLYLDVQDVNQDNSNRDTSTHIQTVYHQNLDIDTAVPRNTYYVAPHISIDMHVTSKTKRNRNGDELLWLEQNQQQLQSQGFDLQGPSVWFDKFVHIGTPEISKSDLNRIIESNNYVVSMEWIDD